MLIGMIWIKSVAVLIGPVGIGILETYKAIVQVIGSIAGLGLQSSAVRSVVEAIEAGDDETFGRTILTLRRVCWLTGLTGALSVALLSRRLSLLTFNSQEHASSIALLGLTIFFANIQGGQMALIQGMRRIGDLAKLSVIGTFAGSVLSISLYFWLGLRGIVPALIAMSVLQLCASWWFARKIHVPRVTMSWAIFFGTAQGMVRLGLAFMWNALLVAMVAYVTRSFILREYDLVAVGIYAAAFGLSGMVVNFILRAMSADYYPSLTAVANNNQKMRKLVNEQTEIALLLAIPGILLTLAFAPWIIKVFYSREFADAAILLQWFVVGCLGRIISWPMAFIILAKGQAKLFALIETFSTIVHLALIFIFLTIWGVEGVAIAFVLVYIVYICIMLLISRSLIMFSWSIGVLRLLGFFVPIVVGMFMVTYLVPEINLAVIGIVVTVPVTIYCLRGIIVRLGRQHRI